MNKNKLIQIIVSVMLVVVINTMVNISDDLHLGLRHPEIYFPIVVVGLIGSVTIQIYGAYKFLSLIDAGVRHE